MVRIDGSLGEGGGQVLRSSLSLSMVTGTPFTLENIRAGRKKPGLLRQHLTCVRAAQAVSGAGVFGAELRSSSLRFEPGPMIPGSYDFAVGTAGSAMLVMQSVLPALIAAGETFELRLEGGTHNPYAPPYDFVERAFLPQMARLGARVEIALARHGFFPAGGGCVRVKVEPAEEFRPLDLTERGEVVRKQATGIVAHLPTSIVERELETVERRLSWGRNAWRVVETDDSAGPGNVLLIELEHENVTEICTGFGEHRVRAEAVAEKTVKSLREYLRGTAPVGRYLADQLMVPMAVTAGGRFRAVKLTRHARTNIDIVHAFLPDRIATEEQEDGSALVRIRR